MAPVWLRRASGLAMLCSLAGSASGRRAGEEAAAIAPGDIMRNIHFSERVRRGKEFGAIPREPHLDERVHTHWAAATTALTKNEAQIDADLPHFEPSQCHYPVVGSRVQMTEEFWAFGESIKVEAVDPPLHGHSMGQSQLGRVTTSFWNWGSHWMRTAYEWRDPSGEQVIASSEGGAQSWYHNTVVVKDCSGERLAYIKFKLGADVGALHGADVHQDFVRITVHDLVGNEVAVAYLPREGMDGSDWRHRRIVVNDRSSGTQMAIIDQLDSGQDWSIEFKRGSEVVGGLGGDPRVLVMLVAWRDAAHQFGIASIPMWAFVVPAVLLIVCCILWNFDVRRFSGWEEIPDRQKMSEVGADVGGGRKKKVDDFQPDDVPPRDRFGLGFGGWLQRDGETQKGGDASAPGTWPSTVQDAERGGQPQTGGDASARETSWTDKLLGSWSPFSKH